ncbi:MAG: fasciclin domain-containing protein [Gemmatimonadota bacterium]
MFNLFRISRHVALLAGVAALAACSESPTASAVDADEPLLARAPAPTSTSIAAVAIDAGFEELVGALSYVDAELETGLVDLFLNGTDQYTVFAPTNEAFENLYGLLSAVLDTEIDEITDVPAEVVFDVLLYHVTEGRRAANSVVPKRNVRKITSLLGEMFSVRSDGTIEDGLTGLRDDASIVSANISASNGIIHVIDAVIVPPSVVAALTG